MFLIILKHGEGSYKKQGEKKHGSHHSEKSGDKHGKKLEKWEKKSHWGHDKVSFFTFQITQYKIMRIIQQ